MDKCLSGREQNITNKTGYPFPYDFKQDKFNIQDYK